MKGVFYVGDKSFKMGELKLPPLGENDLLIKNMACGVCGTDVHVYNGEVGSAEVNPPIILGHEYAGIVMETGKNVVNAKVGDKVTLDPNIYCGKCRFCRNGKKQHCENREGLGVTIDGGFAEYSIAPDTQAFLLADDVSFEEGAMVEPLACCIHGLELIDIRMGNTVCVIGGGAIGLLMTQLIKLSGASCIILSEPIEKRRKAGALLGADYCIDPINQNLQNEIKRITGNNGVDVVVECAGTLSATKQSFEIADAGATVLLFSVPDFHAKFDLELFDVFKKELHIQGSFINPYSNIKAVNMINSKKINIKPLITHRFGLEEMEKAIHTQTSPEAIKVMVIPRYIK